MPEGHTLHRLAREHQRLFGGSRVEAGTLMERFADGAAAIDGTTLARAEAYGKHLFHHYDSGVILHVHLGLYGKFVGGTGAPPPARGALRLRLTTDDAWADLRGPTACELVTPAEVEAMLARLGPDPLARRPDPTAALTRIARSRTSIAALLMDQKVLAGVGNVYRAEVLFRHQLDPFRPGRDVPAEVAVGMWDDLVTLMRDGVRTGRIITIRDKDRPAGKARSRLNRDEAVYVYRRSGLPCRICGTPVATQQLVARNLFWCPSCQAPA